MNAETHTTHGWLFEASGLGSLFDGLRAEGHTLYGPTVRDGAIVYDEIQSPRDLPVGLTDVQEAGRYRLEARGDGAFFGFVVGPQSWKRFLFPPRLRLFRAHREPDRGFSMQVEPPAPSKRAFIGVRGCELAAIAIQDTVFTRGTFTEPHYQAARDDLFVLGVNCVQAAPTCFCTSMGTGPRARGADLSLTEVVTADRHFFVVTEATERGRAALATVDHRRATPDELALAWAHEDRARDQPRRLETRGLADALAAAQEHPQWDAIAERCLSCANCTMVCPTCFCSTVEDVVDITGDHAERWRRWDSCFNDDFTALHGHPVRQSTRARYRQWLTHKLSTWHAQFDSSGCVGCGRCITWCPVGIDLTAEVKALRAPATAAEADAE